MALLATIGALLATTGCTTHYTNSKGEIIFKTHYNSYEYNTNYLYQAIEGKKHLLFLIEDTNSLFLIFTPDLLD